MEIEDEGSEQENEKELCLIAKYGNYANHCQYLERIDDAMNLDEIKISSAALDNIILKHTLLSRKVAAISFGQKDIDQ